MTAPPCLERAEPTAPTRARGTSSGEAQPTDAGEKLEEPACHRHLTRCVTSLYESLQAAHPEWRRTSDDAGMRLPWLVLVVWLAPAGAARADQKLVSFKPDFVREVKGCQVQVSGIAMVLAGATELARTAEPAERAGFERDVEQVTKGHAVVKEYCDEVAGMIAFIDANASAPYRAVAPELDARYKKIVKLRVDSKKAGEELQPATRRLIPLMARRPPPPPAAPKRTPAKFPSGRAVELPALGGAWRLSGSGSTDTADYSEAPPKGPAVTARATARTFSAGTCDEQRQALLVRGDAEQLVSLEPPGARELGVAWGARYTRREQATAHLVSVLCVPGKAGGVLATADVVPADRAALADELAQLLLRMLAARRP